MTARSRTELRGPGLTLTGNYRKTDRIMAKPSTTAANAAPIPADIAALSFEAALAELEQLVKQLEDGKARLDDAIGAYERGSLLRRHCETKLREAQLKIEQITQNADGTPGSKPFAS